MNRVLTMDVPVSPAVRRRRQARRWWLAGGVIVTLAFVTVGLSRLKPAAPLVEKSALFMDTVKRGEMVREVRGNGTLVPEDIRWIATVNAGRVGRILVLPGARVQAGTVLVELSNPDVEQAAFDAFDGNGVSPKNVAWKECNYRRCEHQPEHETDGLRHSRTDRARAHPRDADAQDDQRDEEDRGAEDL